MKADPTIDIPTISTKADGWQQWHTELVSNFGRKEANSLFLKAWGLRGNSAANTLPLRTYLKGYGINLDESAWDKVVDTGGSIADTFGDVFKVGKYAGIALGAIVIGGLAMVVFNIAKAPGQAVGVAAKAMI